MKRRSVLMLIMCGMLTAGMITAGFTPAVYADTAPKNETETEESDTSDDTKSSDSNKKKSSEDSEEPAEDNTSDNKESSGDKKSSQKSDSSEESDNKEETSDKKSDSNTRTVKTATKKSSKSSGEGSSEGSSASSKTDSNGNTLLMTDSQRRSKFRSKTNPKRGVKPSNPTIRPESGMYMYGDFGTFNSYHSENGLGGTPIYLIGTIKDIEKVAENTEGYKAVLIVDDCDGYQWYIRFNVEKPIYDQFKKQFMGKSGYIYGIYSGYSGVAFRPMMDMSLMIPYTELPGAAPAAVDAEPAQAAAAAETAGKSGNVSKEMKSFLDSFEAFMDVYVNFMNAYKSDPSNAMKMLNESASITQQYVNYLTKAQAYLNRNLSPEDTEYLATVLTRIEKKSLEVAQ